MKRRSNTGPIPTLIQICTKSASNPSPATQPGDRMLTITFAFVVATALFFVFERTRGMGVVGVFVLLCINPLLFSGLFLLAGLAVYFIFYRRNKNDPPKPLPRRD